MKTCQRVSHQWFNIHLIKTPKVSSRAHENHFISISLKGKTYNHEEHLHFWENTCWILVKFPPRKIRTTTPTRRHARSWEPGLMELRSKERYSTPGSLWCRSLWTGHLSTRLCQQSISAIVPGPNSIFIFQYLIVGTREWKKHTAHNTRGIHSPGKEESMPEVHSQTS